MEKTGGDIFPSLKRNLKKTNIIKHDISFFHVMLEIPRRFAN